MQDIVQKKWKMIYCWRYTNIPNDKCKFPAMGIWKKGLSKTNV